LTRDGTRLVYRLWRPGAARRLIVLIHGVASNMTRWSEFVEHTSLKDTWDILWLDLRGHGESFYRGRLGMKVWCRDLIEILDTEGYGEAVIVGHSLGAQVALNFVSRYPDRVSGLVLIDPVFHQALTGTMRMLSRLRPLLWFMFAVVWLLNRLGLRRRQIPNRDLRALDEDTRKRLLDVGKLEEMVDQYGSPWPDLQHLPTGNFIQELIVTMSPVPPVAGIKVPVLALLAAAPTYTDPATTKQIIGRMSRGTAVDVHAFHWPLTEKPQETREAIERWCAQQFASEPGQNPSA